ncbi:MAG TPA: hypothetical protein VEY67_10455 [Candidatus Dormibacteraeota bacterium]|nr:hypothetical protein [Candidatus Dormibacteraeota bacterium]
MSPAMPSDALLRHGLSAYERLARAVDGAGDPELGLATAFACGRRALLARLDAEAWLVPPSVVSGFERLLERMAAAADDEIDMWIDAFPNRILELLERRTGRSASARSPRRRWIDRVGEDRLLHRPVPALAATIGD